uniref:hypothetical protein n=1 Tax=Streptomyces sp. 1222.5 TaxID=1881026 RepID=UPI003EBDB686
LTIYRNFQLITAKLISYGVSTVPLLAAAPHDRTDAVLPQPSPVLVVVIATVGKRRVGLGRPEKRYVEEGVVK